MPFDLSNHEACYRAALRRDARFDGRFYMAVTTTRIFCRPVCPSPPARREHCRFYPSAPAAMVDGYRPCMRCRPELAPGAAGWDGSETTVKRAMAFIADGGLGNGQGIDAIARHAGVGARHLRRLFDEHVGASPVQVANAHRIALARALLVDSGLPVTDVAYAAGFRSLRRFNDAFRTNFGQSPSVLRRSQAAATMPDNLLRVILPCRAPFDWDALIRFFAERAVPGIESVADGEYRRTFRLGPAAGCVRLAHESDRSRIVAHVRIDRLRHLPALMGRLRHLLDVDADPAALMADLGDDPWLGDAIRRRPGLRIPGAIDVFEQSVRAVLGQQVSLRAARTLAARIAARWGGQLPAIAAAPMQDCPAILFPRPRDLIAAPLEEEGVLPQRARTIRILAKRFVREPGRFGPFQPAETVTATLRSIAGIGDWTAEYIGLRALGNPDAFPASDLGLLKAARRREQGLSAAGLRRISERWRPWRGYAATCLWSMLDEGS
jgi:AraC family transcriptional regulator of adaptative response / DNA-3-methyladenine glycosylase II